METPYYPEPFGLDYPPLPDEGKEESSPYSREEDGRYESEPIGPVYAKAERYDGYAPSSRAARDSYDYDERGGEYSDPYDGQYSQPASPAGRRPAGRPPVSRNSRGVNRTAFAFKVRNLTKSYGYNLVLNNISFDIPAGKIVGLLGPNGCGKTTLIKILTGMINDYTGVVKVGGKRVGVTSKARVAYLPDRLYFPKRFRTIDCINYYADCFKDFDRIKAMNFVEVFGIDLGQRVKTMSKGMQEKLQLLIVMSREADIYILDEPLGGVDPAARGVILDLIMNNYKENATVLISTHLVNDLERSFDHVMVLGKGKVLVNTGIEKLRSTGKTVEEIFKEVIGDAWEVD